MPANPPDRQFEGGMPIRHCRTVVVISIGPDPSMAFGTFSIQSSFGQNFGDPLTLFLPGLNPLGELARREAAGRLTDEESFTGALAA
jgi:hypothetical protein